MRPARARLPACRSGRKEGIEHSTDSSDSDDAVPVPAPVPVPVVGRCTYKAEVMNQTCCAGFLRNGYASLKLKVIIFTEHATQHSARPPLLSVSPTKRVCFAAHPGTSTAALV